MQDAANANEFRSAGIDVSKATLHVHVLPGNAKFQVPNDKTGVVRLCRELAACGAVVMEATGRHHRLAQQALLAAGLRVAVLNPRTAHDFAAGEGVLAKTDKVDARTLALYGAQKRPAPPPADEHAGERRELLDLLRRRDSLVAMRAAERCRADEPGLCAAVRGDIAAIVRVLDGHVDKFDRLIDALVERVDAFAERARRLRTAPGVGRLLAAFVVATMPWLGDESADRRAAAAFAGVAPLARDSGRKSGARRIAGGCADLRRVLYLGAQSAAHAAADNPIAAHHARLVDRGKPPKVAAVACMNKLLGILHAMLRDGTDWGEHLAAKEALST